MKKPPLSSLFRRLLLSLMAVNTDSLDIKIYNWLTEYFSPDIHSIIVPITEEQ